MNERPVNPPDGQATRVSDDKSPLRIEVLSRPGCGLCEEMIGELEFYLARTPFDFAVRDISEDQQLIDKYGLDIPILMINEREISRHTFSRADLERELSKVA